MQTKASKPPLFGSARKSLITQVQQATTSINHLREDNEEDAHGNEKEEVDNISDWDKDSASSGDQDNNTRATTVFGKNKVKRAKRNSSTIVNVRDRTSGLATVYAG